jgi:HD-GYP domain-containing protein (c-di-GMP phosphodiesterase class II)
MPITSENEFIGISLGIFKRLQAPLFFDVYVKLSDTKYTKLFNHGDMIDWERASSYAQKGVQSFFVTLNDYDKYNAYVSKVSAKYLAQGDQLPSMEKVGLVKELVTITMHDLVHKTKVNQQVIGNASVAVASCIGELENDPKSMLKIIKLMSTYPDIFKHSIGTSIFAVMLAKADDITNPANLLHIGMGAFLHDIGHSFLSFNTEETDHLSPEQWKEMKTHPEIGKRQLDAVKGVRSEVLDIIFQHHEQPNGHGYPNNLKGPEIYRPAKIVSIADSFSALISDRPYRKAFTPSKAFEIMQGETGKYDAKLLKKFYETLLASLK